MSNRPWVLVIGATVQVGSSVASLLARNPELEVLAACNPASATHRGGPVVPLDLAHLYAAFARDRADATRSASEFSDAVKLHRIIDAIYSSSDSGHSIEMSS